jgi:HAD superfamily hydrolase (TIGR01490 family)
MKNKENLSLALAIFDLDNTLIAGDSDHLWGEFLVEKALVDADYFKARNDAFYQDYVNGTLDMTAYLDFSLAPLAEHGKDKLNILHEEFMTGYIQPIMLNKARMLLNQHRAKDDTLLIITATNRFVTAPIAKTLGVDHLLAIELEEKDGRYTGKVSGVPSYREGKITRLNAWLKNQDCSMEGAYFYSDSHNDLPLLETVAQPIAVDPDEKLADIAKRRGWKIISLRDA